MALAPNKTNRVCTIGPASESPEILRQMLHAGMNIARLDFSHGEFSWHRPAIDNLGGLMTDFNTGGFTTNLDDSKTISANIRSVKIKHHYYENVYLLDFILGLTERLSRRDPATLDIRCAAHGCVHRHTEPYGADAPKPLTIKRFFDRMSHFIGNNSIVIAETGVSLFSAAEMLMPEGAAFVGQTFYGSIGYTVGATLGVGMAAQDRHAVLFVGDGSFQMTCQDLSTMIRHRLKPVINSSEQARNSAPRSIKERP